MLSSSSSLFITASRALNCIHFTFTLLLALLLAKAQDQDRAQAVQIRVAQQVAANDMKGFLALMPTYDFQQKRMDLCLHQHGQIAALAKLLPPFKSKAKISGHNSKYVVNTQRFHNARKWT